LRKVTEDAWAFALNPARARTQGEKKLTSIRGGFSKKGRKHRNLDSPEGGGQVGGPWGRRQDSTTRNSQNIYTYRS